MVGSFVVGLWERLLSAPYCVGDRERRWRRGPSSRNGERERVDKECKCECDCERVVVVVVVVVVVEVVERMIAMFGWLLLIRGKPR